MANLDISNFIKVTDKRQAAGVTAAPFATKANYTDIGALRTRLAAINAGYYTATQLNSMTKNDMVYAVRVNDDAAGIK